MTASAAGKRVLCVLLLAASVRVQAQRPVALAIDAGDEFPAEFAGIRGVRELSDGRLLVADSREYRLLLLDWNRGETRSVARSGDGPGEFRSLGALLALPADSTIVLDLTSRRWLLFHDSRFVAALPTEQALHLTQFFSPILGADQRGGVLALAAIPSGGDPTRAVLTRMPNFAESLLVVRMHRSTRVVDTLTAVRGRPWGRGEFVRGEGSRRMAYVVGNPLAVAEQAWLFADGWVAILRKEPYRVDWLPPGAALRRGASLEGTTAPVTTADRQFAIDDRFADLPPPRLRDSDFTGWPSLMPAFTAEALFPLPDGRVAIERRLTRDNRLPRFDVVDRAGARVGTYSLRPRERIVGFGRGVVYVARRDDDDVEYLSRRPFTTRQ